MPMIELSHHREFWVRERLFLLIYIEEPHNPGEYTKDIQYGEVIGYHGLTLLQSLHPQAIDAVVADALRDETPFKGRYDN